MATEVQVPTLGESITEATLGQWLKNPGEAVTFLVRMKEAIEDPTRLLIDL